MGVGPLVRPELSGPVEKILLRLSGVERTATTIDLLQTRKAKALKRSLNIILDTMDPRKFPVIRRRRVAEGPRGYSGRLREPASGA